MSLPYINRYSRNPHLDDLLSYAKFSKNLTFLDDQKTVLIDADLKSIETHPLSRYNHEAVSNCFTA